MCVSSNGRMRGYGLTDSNTDFSGLAKSLLRQIVEAVTPHPPAALARAGPLPLPPGEVLRARLPPPVIINRMTDSQSIR